MARDFHGSREDETFDWMRIRLYEIADTEDRDEDIAAVMRGSEIGPSLHVSCCLDFGHISIQTRLAAKRCRI